MSKPISITGIILAIKVIINIMISPFNNNDKEDAIRCTKKRIFYYGCKQAEMHTRQKGTMHKLRFKFSGFTSSEKKDCISKQLIFICYFIAE